MAAEVLAATAGDLPAAVVDCLVAGVAGVFTAVLDVNLAAEADDLVSATVALPAALPGALLATADALGVTVVALGATVGAFGTAVGAFGTVVGAFGATVGGFEATVGALDVAADALVVAAGALRATVGTLDAEGRKAGLQYIEYRPSPVRRRGKHAGPNRP